jgi:hypothetical protein
MPRTKTTILLWLFIINLGIAFGAGVYEHRIVVPDWLPQGAHWNAEAARQDDTGRRFWAYVTTVPLTLLTLVNLIAARRTAGRVRLWWTVSAVAALADRVWTFSYFIPVMVGLLSAPDTAESVETARQWWALNYVRLAVLLAALLAAMAAFANLYEQRGPYGRLIVR